ncbi:hypothetical protein [Nocardia neocaledoniensis]|nr:hypothetical protein [Nocardia neocaledoniensis]
MAHESTLHAALATEIDGLSAELVDRMFSTAMRTASLEVDYVPQIFTGTLKFLPCLGRPG